MKFEFKDIVWISFITLIVIFLSRCHRNNSAALDAAKDKLQSKVIQDSINYITAIQQLNKNVVIADSVTKVLQLKNNIIEQQLDQRTATIFNLTAALKKAKIPLVDTNTIAVDPDYINYCDSLADVSQFMAADYTLYKNNTGLLLAAKDTAIRARDGIIVIERKAKQDCKDNFNSLMHLYQMQTGKPHNQIYIGPELIATPSYLVSNAGIALSLKTKSNKLWQVSGGIQNNGQYYFRINGNILISLNK